MTKRRAVLFALQAAADEAEWCGAANAELRAAEAVIRAARQLAVDIALRRGTALGCALARLDALTKRTP